MTDRKFKGTDSIRFYESPFGGHSLALKHANYAGRVTLLEVNGMATEYHETELANMAEVKLAVQGKIHLGQRRIYEVEINGAKAWAVEIEGQGFLSSEDCLIYHLHEIARPEGAPIFYGDLSIDLNPSA